MRKDELYIGKRVKELRKKFGFSTKEIAEKAHISEKRLILLESGDVNTIKISELYRIAEVYKMSLKDLLG